MAEKLGLDRVLVPSNAGVGSAVGLSARADRLRDRARPIACGSTRSTPAAANALLAEMRAEAEAIVRRGAPRRAR